MLVLAIDTATHDLVTGLVDLGSAGADGPAGAADSAGTTGSTVSTDKVVPEARGHNEYLVSTIQELLAETGHSFADLGAIVVGHGPGPFTGLRVGMATASAIGQALRIPVFGVSTLDAIAARHQALRAEDGSDSVSGDSAAERLLVMTDARRREVYYATYQGGERTSGPSVAKAAELDLPHDIDAIIAPEHLRERLQTELSADLAALEMTELTPRSKGLVSLADLTSTPVPLEPAYLRRPDAVEPKPVPRSSAIPETQEMLETPETAQIQEAQP